MSASPTVGVSTGITMSWATSHFSCEVTNFDPPGSKREKIDTSNMSTTVAKVNIPGSLVEHQDFSFDGHYNPDMSPPIGLAAETITLTFPSGATWAWSGYMIEHQPKAPLEGKMTFSAKVAVSGPITKTAATGFTGISGYSGAAQF